MVTVSAVVGPRVIFGADDVSSVELPEPVLPRESGHRQTLRALEMMLEHSAGLVAVHGGGAGGGPTRAVLWYSDTDGDGLPSAGELVVLTHHEVAGTVVAYAYGDGGGAGGPMLEPSLVASRGFAERWTFRDDVTGRVVASGVKRFEFEALGGAAGVGVVLGLSWEGDGVSDGDYGRVGVPLARASFVSEGVGGRVSVGVER